MGKWKVPTVFGAAAILISCSALLPGSLAVDSAAAAPKFTVLHRFSGNGTGAYPSDRLTFGKDGALYGTAVTGGTGLAGTAFKLTPPVAPATTWKMTVLHGFSGGADGNQPLGRLIFNKGGALVGTTYGGGYVSGDNTDGGTLFTLNPTTGAKAILHRFEYNPKSRAPRGGVIFDAAGNAYGTTEMGGTDGYGTVFKMTPAGVTTILHSFGATPTDGHQPHAGLAMASDGSLYGTTRTGGKNSVGSIFRLKRLAGGTFKYELLFSFRGTTGAPYGGLPVAPLLIGKDGELYGTTEGVGNSGMVFKLVPPVPPKTVWRMVVLYYFQGLSFKDGAYPEAGLVMDKNGAFYGTTREGGGGNCVSGCGTVFKLTPPAGSKGWVETVLYRFNGGIAGAYPRGGLVIGSDNALYGTASEGGHCTLLSTGCGLAFKLIP